MKQIDPKEFSTRELHGYLLGSVGPRPIAFASTMDAAGNVNLSPYSFFNVFSSNPPTLIFSPARRVRDNTTKHTLENILETKEVVVNIVNHAIVEQMALSSAEFPKDVNEFVKSGLTEVPSLSVRPPRVKEAPVQLECKVKQVIHLGEHGGAGNLILCQVVLMYINEEVLDEKGKIDPRKIDLVGRMGGNWYCRANGASLFELAGPTPDTLGIDDLPKAIRESKVLTGNDLAKLAKTPSVPTLKDLEEIALPASTKPSHELAHELIQQDEVLTAWKALLS